MYVPLRLPEDAAKAADGLAVLRPQEAQATVRESINHRLLFFTFSPFPDANSPGCSFTSTDAGFHLTLRFTEKEALPPSHNSVFTGYCADATAGPPPSMPATLLLGAGVMVTRLKESPSCTRITRPLLPSACQDCA